MLNQDSLSQLKGLKSKMEAEKEHADAVIKGTQAAMALLCWMMGARFSSRRMKCSRPSRTTG